MGAQDIQSSHDEGRNWSLDASRATPDLPNRGTRARLRSIRWLSPLEDLDLPELQPIEGAGRPPLPATPALPTRASLHITDKAWLDLSAVLSNWVYKAPNVVLSILTERARMAMASLNSGDFFAVFVVTRFNEKAIATFELSNSGAPPDGYSPLIQAAERAALSAAMAPGSMPPILYLQDKAEQLMGTNGHYDLARVTHVILEKAFMDMVSGSSAYVNKWVIQEILDKAAVDARLTFGFNRPTINAADKMRLDTNFDYGWFYPWLHLSDKLSLQEDLGNSGMKTVVSVLQDKASLVLADGQGVFLQKLFITVIVDKATLTETTGLATTYVGSGSKVDTGLWGWWQADLGVVLTGSAPNETLTVQASNWRDQSGNNRHFDGVTGEAPAYVRGNLNGNPIIRFNGAHTLIHPSSVSGLVMPCTQYYLLKLVSWTQGRYIIDSGYSVNYNGLRLYGVSPKVEIYNTQSHTNECCVTADLTLNVWHILTVHVDYEKSFIQVDNGPKVPWYIYGGPTRLKLGSANTAGPYYATFDLAAIICRTGAWDATADATHKESLRAYGGLTTTLKLPQVVFSSPLEPRNFTGLTMACPGHPTAAIYYTTDGSTPTTGSILYSGSITATGTIKAIAVRTNYITSDVAVFDFTPTQFANLDLWCKADAITGLADGEAVASWVDSSGNGNTPAQATVGARPIYKTNILNGLPVVRFDATDDRLNVPNLNYVAGTSYTVIVLYAYANAATNLTRRVINSVTSSGARAFLGAYGTTWQYWAGGFFNSSVSVVRNRFTRLLARRCYNPGQPVTQQSIYVDGLGRNHYVYDYPFGSINIGPADSGSDTDPVDGDIAEVIFYSRALGEEEIKLIDRYLIRKYGLFPILCVSDDMESYTNGVDILTALVSLNGGTAYSGGGWNGAWVSKEGYAPRIHALDTMEPYADGADLTTTPLNGIDNFIGAYTDGYIYAPRKEAYDDMESYADGANVNGLNGGIAGYWGDTVFTTGYVAADGDFLSTLQDEDFESYPTGAAGTLNGGTHWSGSWAMHTAGLGRQVDEDYESYSVGAVSVILNGGAGWAGAWSFPGVPIDYSRDYYSVPCNVTLTSPLGGAIYYTTDGSTPTTGSTLYTTPIAISVETTIKTLQVVSGYRDQLDTVIIGAFSLPASTLAWWKADAITGLTDGQAVGTWNDSINSNHLTQSGSNKPIYKTNQLNGLPAVYYTNGNWHVVPSMFTGVTAVEYFAVIKMDADPNTAQLTGLFRWGSNDGQRTHYPWINSQIYWDDFVTGRQDSLTHPASPASFTSWHTLNFSGTAGAQNVRMNGAVKFTFSSGFSVASPYYIGTSDGQVGGYHMSGYLAELIICSAVLSSTDRSNIFSYLANKYGIST